MFRYSILIIILCALVGLTIAAYGLKYKYKRALLVLMTVLILCMIVFDTYLTSLPIVLYNSNSILGLRVGTIPIEDFGYLIVVVVLAPALFEFFRDEKED